MKTELKKTISKLIKKRLKKELKELKRALLLEENYEVTKSIRLH